MSHGLGHSVQHSVHVFLGVSLPRLELNRQVEHTRATAAYQAAGGSNELGLTMVSGNDTRCPLAELSATIAILDFDSFIGSWRASSGSRGVGQKGAGEGLRKD